ncbi:MAG: hypothetical protein GY903_28215 [Fuerstiella sp.]|nr:hypothetical protein [Fuerstiella sp.]MCP4858381.1 hypothetical protein [Fuerstiella sp.]
MTQYLETVIWLEQTEPGQYQRYVVETGSAFQPCLDLGDYDGDTDFATGNFVFTPDEASPWNWSVTVWENQAMSPR